ncbi:MAG TPA: ABC transporter substrate-binding protein [Nocardioides sp.]|nr:ABC transporter substrate-binding protein [Nocardioides sp.]
MSVARLRFIGAALLVTLLTACGSQLSPAEVAKAGGGGGVPGQGVAAGGDASAVGSDTGAAPGDTGSVPDATGGSGSTGASGGGAGGTGTAGGGGSTGGGGSAPAGKGANSATGGVKAASCNGFKNQTGITDKAITIANVSDIGGALPGVGEPAQLATRAYVEYFNKQFDICGRKLSILNLDSRVDAGADQQAYAKACQSAFAVVGSFSGFDSGGAGMADKCGIPDIRVTNSTPERAACKTCFATWSIQTNLVPAAGGKELAKRYGDAVKHAAAIYMNIGGAIPNTKSYVAAYEKLGWKFVMVQSHDLAEFNFAPYVQQMKEKGVKSVIYFGAYFTQVKLQQAMQQQGFKVDFIADPSGQAYDQRYVDQAGSVGDGTIVPVEIARYDDTKNPEMQLYLSWLQQVKPGAVPSPWGPFAWSASRLFVERATALGGQLNRANLVKEFGKVKGWTGKGIHTQMDVGGGATSPCQRLLQLKGGKWTQITSGDYSCAGTINSGIGG